MCRETCVYSAAVRDVLISLASCWIQGTVHSSKEQSEIQQQLFKVVSEVSFFVKNPVFLKHRMFQDLLCIFLKLLTCLRITFVLKLSESKVRRLCFKYLYAWSVVEGLRLDISILIYLNSTQDKKGASQDNNVVSQEQNWVSQDNNVVSQEPKWVSRDKQKWSGRTIKSGQSGQKKWQVRTIKWLVKGKSGQLGEKAVSQNNKMASQGKKVVSQNNKVVRQDNKVASQGKKVVSQNNKVASQGKKVVSQNNKVVNQEHYWVLVFSQESKGAGQNNRVV